MSLVAAIGEAPLTDLEHQLEIIHSFFSSHQGSSGTTWLIFLSISGEGDSSEIVESFTFILQSICTLWLDRERRAF